MRSALARRHAVLATYQTPSNGGKLRVYAGTRPADPDTAIGGSTVLAELTMNATAWGTPTAGSMSANAITGDASADNTGTATWARLWQSDGTTPVCDYSVGVGSGELQFTTLNFVSGVAVNITSFVMTAPVGV